MGKLKHLFDEFNPENYTLQLVPDREHKKFSGSVLIKGRKTSRPSQRLTFHQKDLKITAAEITKHDKNGDQTITVERINHHKGQDEVRLHSSQMIYPGEYSVKLDFKGKITREMNGIYPCFFEHDGQEQQLIATQFESHHAREVFPCIDEPAAKATFDLTLTTPVDEPVIANTPILKQAIDGNQLITTFETTPKMSTYLLAFVYGNMKYKEAVTKDGVVVRTYATPDNVEHTDFALDVAVKCLEFYNEYFDIPYPLPKCDMVALPDFASGAMENWGLITYREQTMLVDPKNTSVGTKQYVAMVIAHELAHQWFGNLVTMRWWTDLWLNEGFASWIEYLAVDHIFPEWQMWTQFAVDEQHRAFKLDALEHTHPVEVAVNHPDEIRSIFDTISYSKGASVIHMLNDYLGAETFRDGLRNYLNKHAYANTDTVDLWNALQETSGKPVKDFMHKWTSLSGFPIVSAKINKSSVELTQQRFFVNPETTKQDDSVWPIALLDNTPGLPELFSENSKTFQVDDTSGVKLNRGQSGFYRVAYDAEHLNILGQKIKNGELSPLDRLGILSDVFEAAKAGITKTVDAFKFLEFFTDETDNAVWDVISGAIVSTRSVMDDESLRDQMKPYIHKLVSKQLSELGWQPKEDESHFQRLLRPTILGLAAGSDHPEVVKECIRKFDSMTNPEKIAPDVKAIVFTTAARHGDKKTFDRLFEIHESSKSSEERVTIAAALTSFKQPELIKRALELINTSSVRLQDVSYWLAYSFSNRFAKEQTWQWLNKHWDWLEKNLGNDLSFYRFPMFAANSFSNREFLDTFKEFFIPRKTPAFERAINQGIEVITWQSAWKSRDLSEVKDYFNQQSS